MLAILMIIKVVSENIYWYYFGDTLFSHWVGVELANFLVYALGLCK